MALFFDGFESNPKKYIRKASRQDHLYPGHLSHRMNVSETQPEALKKSRAVAHLLNSVGRKIMIAKIETRVILGAICMLLVAPAIADGPNYNYVQAGYQRVELDVGGGSDPGANGYGVGGSFEIGDSMYAFVGYSTVDFGFDVDLNQLAAGFGYHFDLSDNTDFFADLAYVKAEVTAGGFGSIDDDGYGATIGVRSNISELIELVGAVNYVDFGDGGDSTAVSGGIWFNLTDSFALGIGAAVDEDITSYGASARLYFGK